MQNKKELLFAAQTQENQTLASHRVAALKSIDELISFNAEDDYKVNLVIIVNAYPGGISQTRVREVLPDASKLSKAVKELNGKEIVVEEISARNTVFKPMKKDPVPTARQEVVSVDTNPSENPTWNVRAPAPTKPVADAEEIYEA